MQLIKELDIAQKALMQLCTPDHLNVAAIGNKTPQLHIHVIGRFKNDPAWPSTVWDHPMKKPYCEKEKSQFVEKLQRILKQRDKV